MTSVATRGLGRIWSVGNKKDKDRPYMEKAAYEHLLSVFIKSLESSKC